MISAFPRFRPAADARSRMQLLGTDGAGLPIVLIRNYDGERGDALASDVEKALGIHMVHQDPQRNINGCGGAAQTDAPSDKYQIIKGIINYEFVHGEEYVDSCKALDMAGRDFVANALSLIEPHLREASTLAALPALDALPTTARPLGKDSVDKDSKPSRVETQVLSYPAGTAEVGYHPHVDKTGTRWVALASLGTAPCDFFWDIARPDKERRSCAAGSSGFNAGSCERWDPDAASRHGSKGRPIKLKGGKAADRVPCRSCRTVTMAPGDVLVFCGEPFSSRVVHGVDSVGASDPLREAAVNAAGLGWLRGRRISLLARGANHRERIVESDQMHEHCTAEYLQRVLPGEILASELTRARQRALVGGGGGGGGGGEGGGGGGDVGGGGGGQSTTLSPPATGNSPYRRAPGKPACLYGKSCYRKNPAHWSEYDHPADHPHLAPPAAPPPPAVPPPPATPPPPAAPPAKKRARPDDVGASPPPLRVPVTRIDQAKELLALLRTTGEATERRRAIRASSFSGDQKLMQFAKNAADRDDVAADRTPGRSRRQRCGNCGLLATEHTRSSRGQGASAHAGEKYYSCSVTRNCHNFSDDEKRRVGLRVM